MSEWRDIESAPKDLTPILLYFGDGIFEVGKAITGDDGEVYWMTNDRGDFNFGRDVPIRWMPLPAPPLTMAPSPATQPQSK